MAGRQEDLEALAGELAEAIRETEPFFGTVTARGVDGFTWRLIDEDLLTAQLSFDSAHDRDAVTTRSADSRRLLRFSADLESVEIEVLADRVVGQFDPPAPGVVEVEREGEVVVSVQVDELGFFTIEPVPTGVVRLRCSTAGTRLVTDWVRL
jgi:hypothetical protein